MAFDVFISYSSKEKNIAQALCAMIEKTGISCWIAPRNVVPGAHWAASIAQAVRNARLLVLLFSENSGISVQVAREVALADTHRLAILPIKIDNAMPDNVLAYYLSVCHWLDISSKRIEDAENEIVDTTRQYLGLQAASALPDDVLLDIYDSDMNHIGAAKRGGIHREGLWHKTMHCWFVSKCDGEPCVWFQRRSGYKSDFPGLFDITAGRHILASEADRDAVGKIHQELSVPVSFNDVQYIGVRTYSECIDKFYNREFNSVYLYNCGELLEHAIPNPKEVTGVIRLDAGSALQMFCGDDDSVQAAYFANNERENITVKLTDFVPRNDNYYQTICRLAKGFFDAGVRLEL